MRMSRSMQAVMLSLAALCCALPAVAAPGDAPADLDANEPTTQPVRELVTEEQEEVIMDFLHENLSYQYQGMVRLKERDPRMYQAKLQTWQYWLKRLETRPRQVQLAYVRQQEALIRSAAIVRKMSQVAKANRDLLVDELQNVLEQLFDAEQIIKRDRLDRLEAQLKQLRHELKERDENRQKIIRLRVEAYRREALQRATTQPADSRSTGQAESDSQDGSSSRTKSHSASRL